MFRFRFAVVICSTTSKKADKWQIFAFGSLLFLN
jgi:hypothetical protein